MKQLTGLDATFLHMENAAQFGHVSGLSIFARPDEPGYEPYRAWRAQLEQRLHLLPPLRRRLKEVPLGLDHPSWVDDPDFDLDFHLRHTAVPPPGTDAQLATTVSRLVARPLDRRRPPPGGPAGPPPARPGPGAPPRLLFFSGGGGGGSAPPSAVLTIVHHA